MEEAEVRLRALGCPKISLQIRSSNADVIEFYRRIGFSVDDVVSMGTRLEEDSGQSKRLHLLTNFRHKVVEQDLQVIPTGQLVDPLGGYGIGPILNPS